MSRVRGGKPVHIHAGPDSSKAMGPISFSSSSLSGRVKIVLKCFTTTNFQACFGNFLCQFNVGKRRSCGMSEFHVGWRLMVTKT